MTESNDQRTPIESLLQEADAAERAGVFQRTSVSPERLLRESWSDPVPLRATIGRKWIPVAAAIGIATIVWPVLYQIEFGSIREEVRLAELAAGDRAVQLASEMSGCVAGPDASRGAPCRDRDYDADGDIDLADYSHFQLAFASSGG